MPGHAVFEKGRSQGVVVAEQSRKVCTERNSRRAGQGREVEHEVRPLEIEDRKAGHAEDGAGGLAQRLVGEGLVDRASAGAHRLGPAIDEPVQGGSHAGAEEPGALPGRAKSLGQ